MANAVKSGSWARNSAWVDKFWSEKLMLRAQPPNTTSTNHHFHREYVKANTDISLQEATKSQKIPLAFLASVARANAGKSQPVESAKRAVNLLRGVIGAPPLESQLMVKMLAKGFRNLAVKTKKQNPAMLATFVAAIVARWGVEPMWWKRQVALMVLLMFCTVGRGAEISSCPADGIAWVRHDGTQPTDVKNFKPMQHCTSSACRLQQCVRGFLLLMPSRKNRRNSPSWIPVAETSAVAMTIQHLRWRKSVSDGRYLFPARVRVRAEGRGAVSFNPSKEPDSMMSTVSLRFLMRKALVECCGLTQDQANRFGTHSPRVGAIEELRRCGAPAELRQQMGSWMSHEVALTYLQLHPKAQFDILQAMGESPK